MTDLVDFTIRQGDTAPIFEFTIEDANGPVDLTGSDLKFHLSQAPGKTALIDAAAIVDSDQTTNKGKGSYEWVTGDTDDLFGKYYVEVEVTFPDGKVRTFPNGHNDYALIEVTRQLA